MASAKDVAEEMLRANGARDTFSLHKLLYYAQAYHLAKHRTPLFDDAIEAWTNGPTVRTLFQEHRGEYRVETVGGDVAALDREQLESISEVLELYGSQSDRWLVNQTHLEAPWREAREGLAPDERGSRVISIESILKFYEPIFNDSEIEGGRSDAASERGLTGAQIRQRYDF